MEVCGIARGGRAGGRGVEGGGHEALAHAPTGVEQGRPMARALRLGRPASNDCQ